VTASRTSSTAGRRRPGGRTQAERRASSERNLLDAAAQVIAERGTTSVSFADIAKVAGCSHGLPGYLFGSKTELLRALVDDVLRALREQTFEPSIRETRGLVAVRTSLRAFVESLADPSSYTRAMYVLLGEAPGAAPELRDALVTYQSRLRRLFQRMVEDGIERGEVRPDVDPATQAVLLVGMARGIGQQVVLDPASMDLRAAAAAVVETITRSLATDGDGS
jgi:AcrR family transcriptional regulator